MGKEEQEQRPNCYAWQSFEDSCLHCGDDAEVYTDTGRDNYAGDGDEARCVSCACPGHVSVGDEEDGGHAWIVWHDEPGCNCQWCRDTVA